MKGIIFSVVEETICAEYGVQVWDELLTTAGLPGGYSTLGDYPDEELYQLIAVGSHALQTSPEALTRHLGTASLKALSGKYPEFMVPHTNTRDFMLTLNDVIHPEVRKLHPHANPPEFEFSDDSNGDLLVGYRSARRLCAFADGMIVGAAGHFGQSVVVQHDMCTSKGDETCLLRCTFSPRAETGLADVAH